MSLDIVNMLLTIDDIKGIEAVRLALNTTESNKPSTECLYNKSLFGKNHLYRQMELQQVCRIPVHILILPSID